VAAAAAAVPVIAPVQPEQPMQAVQTGHSAPACAGRRSYRCALRVSVDSAEAAVLCCTSIMIALEDATVIRRVEEAMVEEAMVEEAKANRACNVEQRWGWQRKLMWQ